MQPYETQESAVIGAAYYTCQEINLIVSNFYEQDLPCNPLVEKCLLKGSNGEESSSEETTS